MNDPFVRCPYCGEVFGKPSPGGGFHGDFKCRNCKLQFIIDLPLPILIYQRSATSLLYEKWHYAGSRLKRAIDPLTECVLAEDGHPLLLWSKVEALAPDGYCFPRDNRRVMQLKRLDEAENSL